LEGGKRAPVCVAPQIRDWIFQKAKKKNPSAIHISIH